MKMLTKFFDHGAEDVSALIELLPKIPARTLPQRFNMEDTPYVTIGCVANLFSRQMHFRKAGDMEYGHTHPFDHLTLLAAGSLRVTVEGKTTEFKAPHMIYIKAEHRHELVALEDNTVAFCIHALRTGERVEDILDPSMVPAGVSPMTVAQPLVCAT